MKVSQEEPGPPAFTAWFAKERSNDRAETPRRPNDAADGGQKTHAGRPAPSQHIHILLHLALFPAGGPFLPSLFVNTYLAARPCLALD
jgi:hypothetical protein